MIGMEEWARGRLAAELRTRGITREREADLTDEQWAEIAAAAGCPPPPPRLIGQERPPAR
jgi:hypothetical protein